MPGVLELLHHRKNRVTASNHNVVNAASPTAEDSGTATLYDKEDNDEVVVVEEPVIHRKPLQQETKKTLAPHSVVKSSKQAPPPPSSTKKTGLLHSFFGKKTDSSATDSALKDDGSAEIVVVEDVALKEEKVDAVEERTPEPAVEGAAISDTAKPVLADVAAINIAPPPNVAAVTSAEEQTSLKTADEPTATADGGEKEQSQNDIPAQKEPTRNSGVNKSKELSEGDMLVLKEQIRLAGTKSKEALIKEIRGLLPHTSERQITLKVNELGCKLKLPSDKSKSWRLKDDVPPEELAAALVAETEKKAAKPVKTDKPEKSEKSEEGQVNGPPETESVSVKTPEPAAANTVEAEKAAEKPTPLIVKPRELEPKAKDLLEQTTKLMDDTKLLLREIFENCECVRPATVVTDLAKTVPSESFQSKQPSDEAIKLMSVIISDSRRMDKADVVRSIAKALSEIDGQLPPDDSTLESWMDLVAKKVEYFEDCWAYEMERKDEKVGKSRRAGLRSVHAIFKTLAKLEKDIQASKLNPNYEKMETIIKENREKLAKAQREWFNREDKKIAMTSAGATKSAKTSKADAASTSASMKEAPAPTPKPKNTLLNFFGSSAKRPFVTAPSATAPATAPATTALLSKFNEVPPATEPSDVEFVGISPSSKRARRAGDDNEDDDGAVEVVEDRQDKVKKRKSATAASGTRKIFLFIDSRVRCKVYRKSKDDIAYFGRSQQVRGRRPLGKSDLLDYEIDSEDEDGESLSGADSGGDEDEEDSALDYKDGWLERDEDLGVVASVNTDDPQQQLARLVPRVIGVCFGMGSLEAPLLSIRNQPFEAQSEDPLIYLSKFSCNIRQRTVRECEDVIRLANSATCSTASSSSPAAASKKNQVDAAPVEVKKKRVVQELNDGESLKLFVQIVEGSTSSKANLIGELAERLKQEFPETLVQKSLIEVRLNEIAERVGGKQWIVKEDVMKRVGLERKPMTGSLSLFEKLMVLQELKKQKGEVEPSEQDIAKAEQIFLQNKLKQQQQKAKAAKAAAAAAKALKPVAQPPAAVASGATSDVSAKNEEHGALVQPEDEVITVE